MHARSTRVLRSVWGPEHSRFLMVAAGNTMNREPPGAAVHGATRAMAPTRTAQVVYGTDPAQVTLSVSGTTYSKSSMGAAEPKFVASDREHLTVTLEHADPGASDDPRTWVAVSDYPSVDLKRNLTYKTTGMWSAALQVPALRREGEYRLAIREYERFDQTTAVGTTTNYAMADRLIYAETMPLKAT